MTVRVKMLARKTPPRTYQFEKNFLEKSDSSHDLALRAWNISKKIIVAKATVCAWATGALMTTSSQIYRVIVPRTRRGRSSATLSSR